MPDPNSIPAAQRGGIITSDQFNQMRQAIIDLSNSGGGGGSEPTLTSFSLHFNPVVEGAARRAEWNTGFGEVTPTSTAGGATFAADGWMQIQLPDGSELQSLTVIGQKKTSTTLPSSFRVFLRRRSLSDQGVLNLINFDLKAVADDDSAFRVSKAMAPIANVANANIVDNKSFIYFIQATLTNSPADLEIKLFAVQVECGPSTSIQR